jgi:glycosyltransferase involved in cell wall biosynthesis
MKICTWGEVAGALEGKTKGGGELQIALLAKALARAGHEVVNVDLNVKNDYVTKDGIKVFQIEGYDDGIRFFRFLTVRLPKLYSALKAQKADVYYCQIRDFRHILAFWAARKNNGIFVLKLSSNLDAMGLRMKLKYDYLTNFGGIYWLLKTFLTELVFPKLVRKADIVLVQHEEQRDILLKRGINSIIFNNLIELNEIPEIPDPKHDYFSYVGSLDSRKGFAQCFELIKRAPFANFKIIGQPRDRMAHTIYEKLKSFSNVTLSGRLPHSETIGLIANSKALISTSPMEGFPNIFIEAWACGIPVLSLSFDPGGRIKKKSLGKVADGNIDKMLNYMVNVKNTEEFARNAKEYVENYHEINVRKINEISTLFSSLTRN